MNRGAMHLAAAALTAVLCVPAGHAASADVDAPRPDGSTPLQWAAFNGDIAEAKRLLAAGADVARPNNYGVNAMQLAADTANTDMIRLLLKAGADPVSPNPEGETALHLVARAGNLDAAKLLLKAGANVDARERFGEQTPLMWAVARRHPAVVELLAAKGADVNARSAIRDYQRVATAESRGKQLDRGGFTPLLYAARENCRECVEVLLKHKADVNLPDPSNIAPVVIAMMNSNWDIARRLIEAGADVNQWDIFGQSPLHVAIGNMGSTGSRSPLDSDEPNKTTGREVIQLLLDRGANPNQQTYFRPARGAGGGGRGTTPFLVAVGTGDVELVKLLLDKYGANPKLATSDGQGAIILAVGSTRSGGGPPGRGGAGGGAVARAGAGAAPAAAAGAAGAPRPVQRTNPTVELINVLARAGADVNLMSKRHFLQRTRGGTALHYAVRAANREVMAGLVDLGIDVNARDEDGLTALDYAMGRGYVPFLQMAQPPRKDLADMLRGWGAKVELDRTPDWPPQGPPIATAVYDAVIWPVDPVGP
jgi:uncharacterized protein